MPLRGNDFILCEISRVVVYHSHIEGQTSPFILVVLIEIELNASNSVTLVLSATN